MDGVSGSKALYQKPESEIRTRSLIFHFNNNQGSLGEIRRAALIVFGARYMVTAKLER